MIRRYVVDTNVIISYFIDEFRKIKINANDNLSNKGRQILEKAFNLHPGIRISIPSMVFVEIYKKFCKDKEAQEIIKYNVFTKIIECEYFEIREIDEEVIENLIKILDFNGDNHDKIVIATAMVLNCPLIANDSKINKYIKKNNSLIPSLIN